MITRLKPTFKGMHIQGKGKLEVSVPRSHPFVMTGSPPDYLRDPKISWTLHLVSSSFWQKKMEICEGTHVQPGFKEFPNVFFFKKISSTQSKITKHIWNKVLWARISRNKMTWVKQIWRFKILAWWETLQNSHAWCWKK